MEIQRRRRRLFCRLGPRLVVRMPVVGQGSGGVGLVGSVRREERRGCRRSRRGGSRAVSGGARAGLQLVVAGGALGCVGAGGADGLGGYLGGSMSIERRDVCAVVAVRCVGAEGRRRQSGRGECGGRGRGRGLRQGRGRRAGAASDRRPRQSQRAAAAAPCYQLVFAASSSRTGHPE